MNITLPLPLLLQTIFADNDALSTARSHWIRRTGRPISDLPHVIIDQLTAKAIALADPDSLATHIQEVRVSPIESYSVLWSASFWAESNERRYQSRIVNTNFVTDYYGKLAYKDQVEQRFWDIAGKVAGFFGKKQAQMLVRVKGIWRESGENEEVFKQALRNIELALDITLYINPPTALAQKETVDDKNTKASTENTDTRVDQSKENLCAGVEEACDTTEQGVDTKSKVEESIGSKLSGDY